MRSFPPFTGPNGEFSWAHPMGTDNAGRDQLARVLQGGQISLFVGIIATLVSLLIGVSYGAIAGYFGGRVDNVMMRIVDVLYSLAVHDRGHRVALDVSQPNAARAVDPAVHRAGFGFMVDDGAHRSRPGLVVEEPGVCARGTRHRSFGRADNFSPSRSEHVGSGDRLCDVDDSADHVDGSVSVVSRFWRAGAARFVGQPRG